MFNRTHALTLLALVLCGCAGSGKVMLAGQFSTVAPPPTEMRVMLDPHYGHRNCDHEEGYAAEVIARGNPFSAVIPHERGHFESPAYEVKTRGPGGPEEPVFFVSFINEQDVLYAVGEAHSAFQWRAYDAYTKAPLPREGVCWKMVRGVFSSPDRKTTALNVAIAPNFDAPKTCLPPGTFTPEAVAPELALND